MKSFFITTIFTLIFLIQFSCVKEVEKVVEKIIYKEPTDSSGCISDDSLTICYTKTSPCGINGEEFTFTASGKALEKDVEWIEWYFGDGDYANGKSNKVKHRYVKYNPDYVVLLKIKKNGTYLNPITIKVLAAGQKVTPVSKIYWQSTNIVGKTATYYFQGDIVDSEVGNCTYDWNFGDGQHSNERFISHTYNLKSTEQKVNVILTITGRAGCQSKDSFQISIPAYYNIIDSIAYNVTDPCSIQKEIFTFIGPINNVPSNAQYIWDFGDGSTGDSNYYKKIYTYQKTYPVKLTIVHNNREIYKNVIPVVSKGQSAKPIAKFDLIDGYTNATDREYHFNNPYNPDDSYYYEKIYWNFGDGTFDSTRAKRNPSKIYKRLMIDKNYDVTMTVISNSGCSNSKTISVFVPKL